MNKVIWIFNAAILAATVWVLCAIVADKREQARLESECAAAEYAATHLTGGAAW